MTLFFSINMQISYKKNYGGCVQFFSKELRRKIDENDVLNKIFSFYTKLSITEISFLFDIIDYYN